MFIEPLFIIVSIVAIIDLYFMLQISNGYGVYFIVITQSASGLFAAYHLRKMSFSLFFFIDAELKKDEKIVKELWEEAWILTAYCLLILPGLISDIVGILLVLPQVRHFWLDYFSDYI